MHYQKNTETTFPYGFTNYADYEKYLKTIPDDGSFDWGMVNDFPSKDDYKFRVIDTVKYPTHKFSIPFIIERDCYVMQLDKQGHFVQFISAVHIEYKNDGTGFKNYILERKNGVAYRIRCKDFDATFEYIRGNLRDSVGIVYKTQKVR